MGMASKLNTALDAKSGDNGIKVNPDAISINPALRARWEQRNSTHIDNLAQLMVTEGQLTAVVARRTVGDDGKLTEDLELIAGEHRLAAAIKINGDDELKALAAESNCPNFDKKAGVFRLSVNIVNKDDKEALFAAIDENDKKKGLSPIDRAYLMKRLKDDHGMSNDEVAKRFNCGGAWVSRMLLLMDLDDETRRLVHEGKLAQQKAMDLASLNDDQRKQVIEQAKKDDGTLDSTAVTEGTRAAANANKDTGDGNGKKQVGRSMTEFRKDLNAIIEDETSSPRDVKFAKDILRYVKGKVGIQGGIFNAADRRAAEAE